MAARARAYSPKSRGLWELSARSSSGNAPSWASGANESPRPLNAKHARFSDQGQCPERWNYRGTPRAAACAKQHWPFGRTCCFTNLWLVPLTPPSHSYAPCQRWSTACRCMTACAPWGRDMPAMKSERALINGNPKWTKPSWTGQRRFISGYRTNTNPLWLCSWTQTQANQQRTSPTWMKFFMPPGTML